MSPARRQQIPIAVVGVSALFPGSTDARGFWDDILAGKDLITDVPSSHWLIEDYYDPDPKALDKTYAKRGGFLEPVDFDPLAFGVPPSIVPATDSAQILALIVAQKVLEDAAQGQFAAMDRERISVLLGVTSAQELLGQMTSRLQKPVWLKALRESGIPETEAQEICGRIASNYTPWQESTFPGLLGNVVAGRIANRFDLRGTNAVTDAACASSLAAVSMGINELQLGQSDLVITGGVDAMNDIFMYMCFSKTPALSPTGDCRPFSDNADGTLLGEGIAMLALKRLEDAERDGDRVYAVIRGVGTASDGRANSVYAPLPEGQARSLTRAYEVAGFGPETVELVEAHGTGTKAGDAAEFAGLKLAFGGSREDLQWCALGSVKSQIGHAKAAAGAAGLFKAVMALHHKVLPPTIKVERPNPKLDIDHSPFYLNTQRRPWIRDKAHPRRASVSSFGFGGSNFHIALEEYVPSIPTGKAAWQLRTLPTELVLLSASTPAELVSRCRAMAGSTKSLSHLARESQTSFSSKDGARLAVIAANATELKDKLTQAAAAIEKAPSSDYATPFGVHYATGKADAGQLAFLFPGQGSQYVGMGADLAMAFDVARQAWDMAANLPFEGERLQDVVFPRPAFTDADREAQQKKLVATEWAQPALGVHSQSLSNLLHAIGVRPSCVAGHSFGEVSALCEAGVFDAQTLVKVARRRGELMRDASAIPGAMTAVAKSIAEVKAAVTISDAEVVIANHNSPTQVVLSGSVEEIEKVEAALAKQGLTAKRLPVATAFHSPLVAGSSVPFQAFLQDMTVLTPQVDVYGNATAAPYGNTSAAIREQLSGQLAESVRFVEMIEAMVARGVRTFVEVGAGSVLTELVGRILGDRPHCAVNLDRKGRHGVTTLQEGLGRLALAGVPMDLAPLWEAYAPPSDLPVKQPAMTMAISGSNYGHPYPPAGGAKELPPPNPPRPVVAAPSPTPAVMAASQLLPVCSPVPEANLAWVHAFQETHRQTAEAHALYQRAMADSHIAYLKAAEASYTGMGTILGAPTPAGLVTSPTPMAAFPKPVSVPMPTMADLIPAMGMTPFVPTPPPSNLTPAKRSASPSVDLEALMMIIVAEKTGYPKEMLAAHMELEADLGIDSIKRVEILSELREREPNLPEVKAADLAMLRTLGQIVEHMRAAGGPAFAEAPVAQSAMAPSVDLEALMMTIVAEKTGYPKEMLAAHMELEADLGIDSIKRVEILSELREREPNLPEVKAADLAMLRTLGQIVAHMRTAGGAAFSEASAGQPVMAPSVDLEALMMIIVAEKTGYPKEMLAAHMELEADLGIDSIKRVEILSELREREPNLPEVKAADLAMLRTLGQIVAHLRSAGGSANPMAEASVVATPSKASVQRYALRAVPASAVGMALSGVLGAKQLVVTDDATGVAPAVVARLLKRGVKAALVSTIPADADAVLFLGGLRAVTSVEDAVAVNREAFRAARAVAARFALEGGAFITVQDTGGDFGLSGLDGTRAFLGGVSALARTAALEWPKAAVKAIDLERGSRDADSIAEAVVTELLEGGTTLEVGLHEDGRRSTLTSVQTPSPLPSSAKLDATSVVVASGGGRGVTAAALLALAKAQQPRMLLLGRTPLGEEPVEFKGILDEADLKRVLLQRAQAAGDKPTPAALNAELSVLQALREIRATLAALKAAGSEAQYLAVDVADAAALTSALDAVRQAWGPITALVHGAGVLADKRIEEKTDEQFDRVFDTKVSGLRALLAATAKDPLTAICLFSSVAARTGNPGQCDYAMANEVLNLVACAERKRRGPSCVVRAIGWGPWDGGMVTPSLKAHFQQMGVALIPMPEGTRRFVEELAGASEDVTVVIGGSNGDGALGAKVTPQATVEVRVDRHSHAYLADHCLAGVPVVPMVVAVEWFLRAARACRPDLVLAAVKQVSVLRGIKLQNFNGSGDRFTVIARQVANGSGAEIAVELRGEGNVLHYSATVNMGDFVVPQPALQIAPVLETWQQTSVYDGHVLFHGPSFQVIDAVKGVSREGIVGTLAGTQKSAWPSESWRSDAAAMDGGLQLALLWSKHVLGGASLPMAMGEYRSYRDGLTDGPVQGVVHGRKIHDARTVCDITFSDPSGHVIAELIGVESVLRPAAGPSLAPDMNGGDRPLPSVALTARMRAVPHAPHVVDGQSPATTSSDTMIATTLA